MDLTEIGIDGANWIQLAQDGVQWQACMNTVMNIRVPSWLRIGSSGGLV
jgi:intracellular sulfur oxidation DsrE/DsrF family protein